MTEPAAPRSATTLPPASANGSAPPPRPAPAVPRRRMNTRISSTRTALIAGVAGALIMAAAGTARITQLRMIMRRDRRPQPPHPAAPTR